MKNIFLLLAFIGLAFASCKKSSPTPIPPPQVLSPLDTTSVDSTIVNVHYELLMQAAVVSTLSPQTYHHDTTNVNIYRITPSGVVTRLTLANHDISYDGQNNLRFLKNTQTGNPKSVSCHSGDSIVVVIDSLQFNTYSDVTKQLQPMSFSINTTSNYVFNSILGSAEVTNFVTNNTASYGRDLGLIYDTYSGTTKHWYVGGRFKIFYIVP